MDWRGFKTDNWNHLCIRLMVQGQQTYFNDAISAQVNPGDVSVIDLSRSDAGYFQKPSFLALYCHHDALGYEQSRDAPIIHFS